MTFNGDGQSVIIDFSDELAKALGFADGRGEGIYEFLWFHSPWRYDDAEQFMLTVDGESCVLRNMLGGTDEDTITLILSIEGEKTELIFERRKGE
jgi:hypothetical protein